MTREERIAKIRGGRWIRYARAEQINGRLNDLLQRPKTHRMPNLLARRQLSWPLGVNYPGRWERL